MNDPSQGGPPLALDHPILIAPDPISRADMLSAGTLLYFESPLILTLPPQVVTQESFSFLELVEERSPEWKQYLLNVIGTWAAQQSGASKMLKMLEPLEKEAILTLWFVYPSTEETLGRARDAINSSGWDLTTFLDHIAGSDACGELVRHLFLEKYLEFGRDLPGLYDYAAQVFRPDELPDFLACAYGVRLLAMLGDQRSRGSVALTKPALVRFLADLPKPDDGGTSEGDNLLQQDAISLALFNEILSRWLHPITEKRVQIIEGLRRSKRGEINRLKARCLEVAGKIGADNDLDRVFERVQREVKYSVMPEVEGLLGLADSAFNDYVEKLLGDRVFWTGFLTTVASGSYGHGLLSAGAAISTLASMGSGAFSQYRETRSLIKKNDYALVYTISQLTI